MAEFATKCPHCNAELIAADDWNGMDCECPICKQMFTVAKETPAVPKRAVPQIKPPAPPVPPANTNDGDAESSFTFICSECGTQVELPIILKGKKYECKACCEESIAEPATEKKCPHCGQMIKFHATICKYCKKNVDTAAQAPLNLQPLSPMGKQPVSLQPVPGNNRVDLQPIAPIRNTAYQTAPATADLIYLSPSKSKGTAILLGVLFCGIGHVYIGQVAKGLIWFGATAIIVYLATSANRVIGAIFWVLYLSSIVDLVGIYKKLEQGNGIKQWDFFFSK